MKRVIYSGNRVSRLTTAVLVTLCFCVSAIQSQPIYFSSFSDPTGKYSVTQPSCNVSVTPPSITNPDRISTSSLSDYASLTTSSLPINVSLLCNGVYLLNADLNLNGLTTLSASPSTPYNVGFQVRISSALLSSLLGGGNDGIIVRTFQDGVPVQTAGADAIGLSLLQPGAPGNIKFSATEPFNEVAVQLSSGLLTLGVASSVDFFYAFASTEQVPVLLPVKLSSFTAVAENKSVAINWVSVSEINVARYEIQRSGDGGSTFNTVAVIAAKGNTAGETKYNYNDGTTLAGSYTYRLRMVDKDGGEAYSKQVLVKIASTSNWKIYPTLLNSGTDLNVSLATTGKAQVQLTNLQGQAVRTASTATDNKIVISTSGLSAGIYVLKLYKEGQLQGTEKVVVQ